MRCSTSRLTLRLTAIAAVCALAFAGVAMAHEFVEVSGDGTVTITGDGAKKPDLVTIDYDAAARDEYIIGHDILNPIPNGCKRDADEPVDKLHCPGSLVRRFKVLTKTDGDAVKVGTLLPDPVKVPVHINTGPGSDQVAAGPEKDIVTTGLAATR